MKNRYLIIFIIFLYSISISAQNEAYTKGVYVDKQKNSMPYRFLQPKKMEKGKKYPLVLFLHGAGERGNDNESQLRNGGTVFSNPANRDKYPCFVLFPQCPEVPTGRLKSVLKKVTKAVILCQRTLLLRVIYGW